MSSVNLDARIAATTRWAPTSAEQRRDATLPMRRARDRKFFEEAAKLLGPDADPAELESTARRLRTLHMLRLSKKSAAVRSERKAQTA